ncbi:hypothetical protein SAMN02745164_02050 [Marinitoga hydrogenitolerans DSM 16785]|uniref:ATPase AAA-type core domain-containing protein n=1 Tax=Marinitoga hydrogenitolerans (strain DSM 16785 / JCM 12826 / AT1271) TaxID=1122195 RepID=A0A1M4ZY96_MARH1|nr:hypothetical protein [Marinitoga hydrogenitolerans]SHF22924.1 hypothetical protein SAMN02745164_02050 [Marinitoga hydrogenitolerans DSM 16785]
MYQNSIHLIEEVDATFHPQSIPTFSKTLINYSKEYNNQLFLTSHNREFLKIFLENINDKEIIKNNIRVFTFKEYRSKLKMLKLNGLEALKNITEFNLELR